jgi:predicted nucleic acid-binding protein
VKKLFIDSDVMLDVGLKREPFYLPALNLLELCYESKFKAVTSAIAFINVHYFLNKFTPLTKIQSLKRLRSVISIVGVNQETIDLALNGNFSDFEDAVQFYSAKSAGAEIIITRNIRDYKESTIQVLTPEQFLKTL